MARNHELALERQRRYRESHREEIRAKGRAYEEKRRRAAGMPALGSPESTENRRRARKLAGDEHPNWKGDAVGYFALHAWIERHGRKTGICSHCGASPDPPRGRTIGTEWANLSGDYQRDRDDYAEVCIPCHRAMDARGLVHGTATGYGYYGCRCKQCRAANTARKRDYLRRTREAVS